MFRTFRILHACDHLVVTKTPRIVSEQLATRASDVDFDVISSQLVSGILRVWDEGRTYMTGIDYEQFTHNKLRWTSINVPPAGREYFVDMEVVDGDARQFALEDCPRCGGNGWYIDIVDNSTNRMMKSYEENKLIQDFLKILLTKKSAGYGTDLLDIPGREMRSVDDTRSQIVSAVQDAERQLKAIQLSLVASEVELPPEEKLYRIDINSLEFDEDSSHFFITLTAYNYRGVAVDLNLSL